VCTDPYRSSSSVVAMALLRFRLAVVVFMLGGLLSGCVASHNVNRAQMHLQGVHDFRAVDTDSVNTLLKTYRRRGEDEVLYRLERGNDSAGGESLRKVASQVTHLLSLARKHDLAVAVTNQVFRDPDADRTRRQQDLEG